MTNQISFTKFTSTNGSTATKTVSVDFKGELSKKSGVISQCIATQIKVNNIDEFANIMKSLKYNECLSYGITAKPSVEINSAQKLSGNEIARTKDNFFWPKGQGILFIDCDKPNVDFEYLMNQLYKAEPFLRTSPMLVTRSTSHGLTNGNTEPTQGGYHVYVVIDDATRVPEIGEALYERLWLNGQGYHSMNSSEDNPAILERCLIDKSVWQTNRIDYCAAPVLISPAKRVDSEFIVLNSDQPPFATENFSSITKTEMDSIRSVKEYSRSRLLPEVESRQEELLNEAPEEEREHIQRRFSLIAENRLPVNHEIRLMDGSIVTIGDIQDHPEQYHFVTCCDPIEHDYRDYAEVAIIYTDDDMPVIHSMAHGGTTYHCEMAYESRLTVDFSGFLKKQDKAPKTVIKNKDGERFHYGNRPIEMKQFTGAFAAFMEWSLHNSKAPSFDISFASAIQEFGTVIGRDFRTSFDNYSNMSITIVGATGCGKDQFRKNAVKIRGAIAHMYPNEKNTLMGKVTSSGAIFTALEDCPRRHMVVDEWGAWLKGAFGSRGDSKKQEVITMLMELYAQSADVMNQTAYSQKGIKIDERTVTPDLVNPFVSFTGITNPADITSVVDESMIRNGFINRNLFFFPPEGIRKTNLTAKTPVPEEFTKWVEAINMRLAHNGSHGRDKYDEIGRQVVLTLPKETIAAFEDMDENYKVNRANELSNTVFYDLMPRVAELALKLSLIFELAEHPMSTEITLASFKKAEAIIKYLKEEEIKFWELYLSVNEVEKHKKEVYNFIVAKATSGAVKTVITKQFQKFTARQKDDILQDLIDSEQIKLYEIPSPSGKGARKKVYYATKFLKEE